MDDLEVAPVTWRKRVRRAWNWVALNPGGAVEADRWLTYELVISGRDGSDVTRFVLRQCPKCSALVQPANEPHHDAWHTGGVV